MAAAISMIELGDEVLAAVAQLEREIETGILGEEPLLVGDEPLGHVLPMDWIADLIVKGRGNVR